MNAKKETSKIAATLREYYYRAWDYLHAYARRYRRAFYSMFTY